MIGKSGNGLSRKINSQEERPNSVVFLNSKEKHDQAQKERISSMPAKNIERRDSQ